jgi:hypothetical protein
MSPSKDKIILDTDVIAKLFFLNKIKPLKARLVKLKVKSPHGSLPPNAKGVKKVKKKKTI